MQTIMSPLVTNLSLPTAMDNQFAFPLWGFVYLGHSLYIEPYWTWPLVSGAFRTDSWFEVGP